MHCVDMIFFISVIIFSSHDLYDGGMRRQQKLLLIWFLLEEQGKIFSLSLHDVTGVGDGTIMVQRGYSLALDDQEVLPLWKELLMCSSIMGDVFDNEHVKEWSYELAGAYLHRPTTLSLGSLGLLMECPQDHFTLDALGGQGGDNDEVMDENIYYKDVIFLTWISKHKKGDLHAAHGSFLFMGVCHTTMEELFTYICIILLSTHGKNIIFASMDFLT